MAKALIDGQLHDYVNLWSRHAQPREFCHLIIEPHAIQFFNNANLNNLIWVKFHPTRGDWSAIDPLYKQESGEPIHLFSAIPTSLSVSEFPPWNQGPIECYVRGHIRSRLLLYGRNGTPATLIVSHASVLSQLIAAFSPQSILWRDSQSGSSIPENFRTSDNKLIDDLDESKLPTLNAVYSPNRPASTLGRDTLDR